MTRWRSLLEVVAVEARLRMLVRDGRRRSVVSVVKVLLELILPVTEVHVTDPPLLVQLETWGGREADQVGVHHPVIRSPFVVLVGSLLQSGKGNILDLLAFLHLQRELVTTGRWRSERTYPGQPVG